MDYQNKNIVLFDGVCNLCNGAVNFLIDQDKHNRLLFASLQSEAGQVILKDFSFQQTNFDTFIFVKNGKPHIQSAAALEVLRLLGGFWQLLYVFMLVPPLLRNGVYRFIAKNRYRWFGQKQACRVPTPELKSKFLE